MVKEPKKKPASESKPKTKIVAKETSYEKLTEFVKTKYTSPTKAFVGLEAFFKEGRIKCVGVNSLGDIRSLCNNAFAPPPSEEKEPEINQEEEDTKQAENDINDIIS